MLPDQRARLLSPRGIDAEPVETRQVRFRRDVRLSKETRLQ
jgi:hypothetical protein